MGDADNDVDDSAPRRRPKLPAALDRLFASRPLGRALLPEPARPSAFRART
jgi:hypothetical protein